MGDDRLVSRTSNRQHILSRQSGFALEGSMAEEDVDLVVPDDDEVVDLTVDGDSWDEIEVAVFVCYAHHDICALAAVLSALAGSRISAI